MRSFILVLACVLFSNFLVVSEGRTTSKCPNKYFSGPCYCPNYPNYCIASGSKQFTYFKMADDLSKMVANSAGISLLPVEGGSIANIAMMRWQNGVKFAIVQSDVLEYYDREAKKGNTIASMLVSQLRVIQETASRRASCPSTCRFIATKFRRLEGETYSTRSEGWRISYDGRFSLPFDVRRRYSDPHLYKDIR